MGSGVDGGEVKPSLVEVDRAAVVGVDERGFPELAALVDIRNPRGGELDDLGRQLIRPPRLANGLEYALEDADHVLVVEG